MLAGRGKAALGAMAYGPGFPWVGLYWGEGHKCIRPARLRLSNADMRLLRVWLAWCQRFLPGVPLKYELNLHSSCDPAAARSFWEEHLNIKVTSTWTAISAASRRRRNTLPNGTLNIQVCRGSLEWYTKMMVWLELAHDLPFMNAIEVSIPLKSS